MFLYPGYDTCTLLRNFIILFTQDEGVKVIAVGVGPSVDFYELKQIAMGNEKYVVQVSQFDDLVTKIKEIIRLSCAARKLL